MYGNYGMYNMNPYQQQLAQNRLNQMEQQYNGQMYQPNYQAQNNQQIGTQMQILKGRPVSSFDEAKASMIDLDGSLFIFTDIGNKRIYTKQIMMDGTAELKTYVLEEQPNMMKEVKQNKNDIYVLKSDFDRVMEQINHRIKSIVDGEKNESDWNND